MWHGRNVTETQQHYVMVLKEFRKEQESLYRSPLTKIWFQQDDTPTYVPY